MVNNAGISSTLHMAFCDDDLADFQRVMAVNVLGVMAGTRDAARHMSTSGGGSIINVSSIGGIQAGGGVMTYRASKAAVIQFTKSAAIELARYDIRVNCLAPGNIPTPILASSTATMSQKTASAMCRWRARECGGIARWSGREPPMMSPRPPCTSQATDRAT